MPPTPEANRDTPKEKGPDEEISMPDQPQFIAPDTTNSEDEDENESHMDLSNGGYQMLAQEPGTVSSEEDDGEDSDANNDAQIASYLAAQNERTTSISPEQPAQPSMQVPPIAPPEIIERQEVWKATPPTTSTPMDQEHAETIKNVMKNIKLPQMNIPSWARLVPEEEWKSQLVDKATSKDSASGSKK